MTGEPRVLGYTIVQHSAFGYKDDPDFQGGLETRGIYRQSDIKTVKRVGGIFFEGPGGYAAAQAYAYNHMYPSGTTGLTPQAHTLGTFSDFTIDGLAIFVPTPTPTPLISGEHILHHAFDALRDPKSDPDGKGRNWVLTTAKINGVERFVIGCVIRGPKPAIIPFFFGALPGDEVEILGQTGVAKTFEEAVKEFKK